MITLFARSPGSVKAITRLRISPGCKSVYTPAVMAMADQQTSQTEGLGHEKTSIRKQLKKTLRQTPLQELHAESKLSQKFYQSFSNQALGFPVMSKATACSAGREIAERVVSSEAFHKSKRLGIYIHCASLREVDTGAILAAALAKGKQSTACWISFNVQIIENGWP